MLCTRPFAWTFLLGHKQIRIFPHCAMTGGHFVDITHSTFDHGFNSLLGWCSCAQDQLFYLKLSLTFFKGTKNLNGGHFVDIITHSTFDHGFNSLLGWWSCAQDQLFCLEPSLTFFKGTKTFFKGTKNLNGGHFVDIITHSTFDHGFNS